MRQAAGSTGVEYGEIQGVPCHPHIRRSRQGTATAPSLPCVATAARRPVQFCKRLAVLVLAPDAEPAVCDTAKLRKGDPNTP